MKTISSAANAKSIARENVEPITLVKIEAGGTIGTLYYADREIALGSRTWLGKIVTIGNIGSVRNQTSGTYNSVVLTLDDSNLALYNQLKSIQFCTKRVTVYEHFVGLSESDAITLLVGEVTTPMSWKEADRSFSFEISTKVRSLPIGYTPFENVQQEIIGKSMPLCYGTVFNVPCQVLVKPNQAKLFDDVIFNDDSAYKTKIKTFRVDQNLYWADNVQLTMTIGNVRFTGHFVGTTFYVDRKEVERLIYRAYDFEDSHRIFVDLTDLSISGQKVVITQLTDFNHIPGYSPVTYTVLLQGIETNALGVKQTVLTLDHPLTPTAMAVDLGLDAPKDGSEIIVLLVPTIFKAGSIVFEFGHSDTVLCFNSIPTTTILSVEAYKATGTNSRSERGLVQLDPSLYTSNLDYAFNGQHLSIITLKLALSYYNQGWEGDTIYVSLISSVGPNTVDIIQDIVTRYTPLTCDANSFALVKTQLEKYPSNFAVFNSKDSLEFIGEICWQARTAYDIIGSTVFLKYLSLEPNVDLEINDNDISEASVELGYTKLEDIVTQLVAQYKTSYGDGIITQNLVYNANQSLYGFRRQVYDFYIYTDTTLVQKSLTFWGNRLSNQWLEINLKTYIKGIVLDIFDCANVIIDAVPTKGIVDEAEYDTLNHEIKFRFWTPLLAGTSTQSSLAWLTDSADIKQADPTAPQMNSNSIEIGLLSIWNNNTQNGNFQKGNALLGIITVVNSDNTIIADIYGNGFDYPATEFSIAVRQVYRHYRHIVGKKIFCVRVGTTVYESTSDTSSGLVAKVKAINDSSEDEITVRSAGVETSVTYTVDLYRDGLSSTATDLNQTVFVTNPDESSAEVGDSIEVTEVGSELWTTAPGAGTLVVGGDNDSEVSDGENTEAVKAHLSDVFTVKDGRLFLNVDAIGLTDNEGLVAELSDLLRIIGTDACLWTNIKRTEDGTTAAPEELTLDTDTFRPAATMLRD